MPPVRHSFSQYYAAPSVTRQGGTAAGSALTGAGTNTAHALAAERRVLLVGGAGAGKTTLLQWLAYTAATAEFSRDGESEGPWRGVVPFFVPLREFADRGLPQPEDFVRVTAPALAGEKPARWVSELLRSGRAMVLVDGVDEVLQPRREAVLLPALRHLEIKSNDVVHDLEGLVACRALRSVWITGFSSALTDLSALSRMHLTDLRLHAGTLDAIKALASVEGTYLPRLSVRHRKLVDGLDVLPEGLRVGELVVDMGADQRDLRGITRLADVHTVAAAGIPSVAEVDELAALPALRALVLTAATPARDLVRLRRLGGLRIELSGLAPADERAAREALPEADLVLHLDRAASITER
ncbi:NACHT domain-containing protein [Amycolatopsis carbonis]|uniref:NACHT domain-containing protein n=1 Tax=Amycolatopsis carbonis TaxID=715471 RepID=A0A9Y2MSF0_9PSEU|nr:NACHT domain-containing protein [Amycolatopsis sp. 2-15]WIX76541.1 NACHT domain-containing protein [Amycolatopsis sp. 2-15]